MNDMNEADITIFVKSILFIGLSFSHIGILQLIFSE